MKEQHHVGKSGTGPDGVSGGSCDDDVPQREQTRRCLLSRQIILPAGHRRVTANLDRGGQAAAPQCPCSLPLGGPRVSHYFIL